MYLVSSESESRTFCIPPDLASVRIQEGEKKEGGEIPSKPS